MNPSDEMVERVARCDTCAHWKVASDLQEWEARRAGFGECEGVRERWVIMDEASEGMEWASDDDDWDEYGETEPPATSYTGVRVSALRKARAYVQDGSQYHAELFTAPDFFCALYAARAAITAMQSEGVK